MDYLYILTAGCCRGREESTRSGLWHQNRQSWRPRKIESTSKHI